MAWLDERNGRYHVCFRFENKKYKKSLKTKSEKQANQLVARIEENLALVERGRLTIPEGADVAAFLLSDGKVAKPRAPKTATPAPKIPQSIAEIFAEYEKDLPKGALESNSLYTAKIHIGHIERAIKRNLKELSRDDLQSYINRRSKQKGLRGNITPTTIRKELATLSAVWNFAVSKKYVAGSFPNRPKLNYPKAAEKPRFQTWEEIERKIARGGLADQEQEALWDCLFLTLPEIEMLIEHVTEKARHDFLHPMVMMAAHTGARRSELIRSQIGDIDLDAGTVTIREKKRVPGMNTTRSVPMSPHLKETFATWLEHHPGGQFTFCLAGEPLTVNQAHDHFKRTLVDSKWSVIRGWHVLRHSFASNAAAAGVDQRIINAWMGHQTEQMVNRYRHLLPNQQQQAIASIFGGK